MPPQASSPHSKSRRSKQSVGAKEESPQALTCGIMCRMKNKNDVNEAARRCAPVNSCRNGQLLSMGNCFLLMGAFEKRGAVDV